MFDRGWTERKAGDEDDVPRKDRGREVKVDKVGSRARSLVIGYLLQQQCRRDIWPHLFKPFPAGANVKQIPTFHSFSPDSWEGQPGLLAAKNTTGWESFSTHSPPCFATQHLLMFARKDICTFCIVFMGWDSKIKLGNSHILSKVGNL